MKKQLFIIILLLAQFLLVFAPVPSVSGFQVSHWGYHARLVLVSGYVDTDLVNFTVLVEVNSTVAGRMNSNGSDQRYTDESNTSEYDYEVEYWNPSGTSYVWVRIPRIESHRDTYFYMHYNNTGASDNQSSVNTWNAGYMGVWHLNESGTIYNDSTANNNDGNGTSITNNASGVVGYCGSKDASTDRISIPSDTSLNITGDITISCWIYKSGGDDDMFLVSKNPLQAYEIYYSSGHNEWRWFRNNIERDAVKYANSWGSWYYFTLVDDGTNTNIYVNNVLLGTDASTTGVTGTSVLEFFNRPGSNLGDDFSLDEIRLSNIARNASWIRAEYRSMTGDLVLWSSQVTINVYDENTSLPLSNWDIFVTNENGTQTYESTGNNNPLILNPSSIPYGDNIAFKFNCTFYDFRVYYYDLLPTSSFNLNAYLPPENISELYVLRVIDDNDNPVEDALVQIRQHISGTYENVSQRLTNANGQVGVYLIPGSYNSLYKVTISKLGYQTEYADYIPDPTFFGMYYPEIFKLHGNATAVDLYTFWDFITFNATKHNNNTIEVNFVDSNSSTLNASFRTYEVFNFTRSLNSTNTTTSNSFTFWVHDINITRSHEITCHLNHSTLGYVNQTIIINPLYTSRYNDLEGIITGVAGNWEFNFSHFFFVYVPCIVILCIFGPSHSGLGCIGTGFYLGFVGFYLSIPTTLIATAPLIITIGMMLIFVKGGKIKL